MGFWYYFAQAMGIIVTALCIINPFFKKKWQMLVNIAAMNVLMAVNFLILNHFTIGSAIVLNVVAIVQAVVNYFHTRNDKKPPLWEQIVFSVLYIGGGFWGLLNATGYAPFANIWMTLLELLPIVGALFNMLSIFAPKEQTMRKLGLGNALVWSVYTAILLSTNFFAEFFAAISSAVALYKYREKPAAKDVAPEQTEE